MIPEIQANWKKPFFIIWVGQAFSLLGSELVQFSLIWYLTKKTGSASVLATASFVALLPRVFLSPISGALVDRWNRQMVMIFADGSIAIATMVLAGVFWFEAIQIWHIYLILFIRALGSGFHWPAMQASTSLMVPKNQLTKISGMNQTLRGAMGIAAPLLAALLLEIFPIYGILFIDVITAIIAIFPLLFILIPQVNHSVEKITGLSQIWDDIKVGYTFLVGWRGLLYLTLAATILNFLLNPGFTFTPLLVTEHFGKGVIELSMIESAFSAGMIIGGMVLSTWGGFNRNIYTSLAGIIGLAVGTGLIAIAPSDHFMLAVFGMSLAGFMNPIANGPIFAIMQTYVEPEMQGRVFSLLESMVSAMMPISMVIAAPVAEWVGIRGWLAFGAIGCFVIGLVGFFTPSLLHIEDNRKKNM
ncbi:MAG: MFS transporter [Anaerolineaceae bacterium]|nr:MFS transporter [Anaerolineaceae bacterium]